MKNGSKNINKIIILLLLLFTNYKIYELFIQPNIVIM